MSIQHTALSLSLIIACCTYSMDNKPLSWEEFRLTRPYGKEKFNFEYLLPTELTDTYFRKPLAQTIGTKFRQRLLNYKYQQKTDHGDDKILNAVSVVNDNNNKTLYHHDGTYNIVPDIGCAYAMWDESNVNKRMHRYKINNEQDTFLLLRSPKNADFGLYAPIEQCRAGDKNYFFLATDTQLVSYKFNSPVNHHILSHDATRLAICTSGQNHNIEFFNTHSLQSEYSRSLGSISALCAAHHSPLLIASLENSEFAFITPGLQIGCLKNCTDAAATCVQLSPDDTQFFSYVKNKFNLCKIHANEQVKYTKMTMPSPIQKSSFSPDGKIIVNAMKDGKLGFINCTTRQPRTQYQSTWRCSDVADIDNQPPLIVWSDKNKLLLTLDPAQHTDPTIFTFVVRKYSNGRFLTAYNFFPHNPRAMGLTEDEKSVVFTHEYDSVSLLNLYTDQDIKDIDFIENKATLFQLYELFQICKNIKVNQTRAGYQTTDTKAIPFITAIRFYIAHYQNT